MGGKGSGRKKGFSHSPETKKKMSKKSSANQTGNKKRAGKKASDETRSRIAAARRRAGLAVHPDSTQGQRARKLLNDARGAHIKKRVKDKL